MTIGKSPESVAANRVELARLDLSDDLAFDLLRGQRRDLARLDLAADLALAEATELQDLEHRDQVDARRDREHPEAEQDEGPGGVEVAVVVGVRDEPKR